MLHPQRWDIACRIIYGAKLAELSREFSISEDSLWRFKKESLPELIVGGILTRKALEMTRRLEKQEKEFKTRQKESTWTLYIGKIMRKKIAAFSLRDGPGLHNRPFSAPGRMI